MNVPLPFAGMMFPPWIGLLDKIVAVVAIVHRRIGLIVIHPCLITHIVTLVESTTFQVDGQCP